MSQDDVNDPQNIRVTGEGGRCQDPYRTVCLLSSELGFWCGLLLNNYWTIRPENWSDHRTSIDLWSDQISGQMVQLLLMSSPNRSYFGKVSMEITRAKNAPFAVF